METKQKKTWIEPEMTVIPEEVVLSGASGTSDGTGLSS